VSIIDGMILMGNTTAVGETPCSIAPCPPHIPHRLVYNAQCLYMDICVNDLVWSGLVLTEEITAFLGPFAKLRKTTISSVVSVHLPVRMEHLDSHWMDFHEV